MKLFRPLFALTAFVSLAFLASPFFPDVALAVAQDIPAYAIPLVPDLVTPAVVADVMKIVVSALALLIVVMAIYAAIEMAIARFRRWRPRGDFDSGGGFYDAWRLPDRGSTPPG